MIRSFFFAFFLVAAAWAGPIESTQWQIFTLVVEGRTVSFYAHRSLKERDISALVLELEKFPLKKALILLSKKSPRNQLHPLRFTSTHEPQFAYLNDTGSGHYSPHEHAVVFHHGSDEIFTLHTEHELYHALDHLMVPENALPDIFFFSQTSPLLIRAELIFACWNIGPRGGAGRGQTLGHLGPAVTSHK